MDKETPDALGYLLSRDFEVVLEDIFYSAAKAIGFMALSVASVALFILTGIHENLYAWLSVVDLEVYPSLEEMEALYGIDGDPDADEDGMVTK